MRVAKHPGPGGSEFHSTGTDQSIHSGGLGVSMRDVTRKKVELIADPSRAPQIREWAINHITRIRNTENRHESLAGSTIQRLNNLYYTADNIIEGALPFDDQVVRRDAPWWELTPFGPMVAANIRYGKRLALVERLRKHASEVHPGTGSDQQVHTPHGGPVADRARGRSTGESARSNSRQARKPSDPHPQDEDGFPMDEGTVAHIDEQWKLAGGKGSPIYHDLKRLMTTYDDPNEWHVSDHLGLQSMLGIDELWVVEEGGILHVGVVWDPALSEIPEGMDEPFEANSWPDLMSMLDIDDVSDLEFRASGVRQQMELDAMNEDEAFEFDFDFDKRNIRRTADFPHGRSIKWPKVYRGLRRRGMSKERAARISNAMSNKHRGGRRLPLSAKAGKKGIPEDILDKRPDLRKGQPAMSAVHTPGIGKREKKRRKRRRRRALYKNSRIILAPRYTARSILAPRFTKHDGPGPHPGTGTDQTVHGRGGGGAPTAGPKKLKLTLPGKEKLLERVNQIMDRSEPLLSSPTHRGGDTMGLYGRWDGDKFLGWTQERYAWQQSVIDAMEQAQEDNFGQAPLAEKKALIVTGLPGAGKTFVLDKFSPVNRADYVTINADDLKEAIIFEDEPPDIGFQGMELSTVVHEESSWMAKDWQRRLQADGTNMILDITGGRKESTMKRINQLIDAGYTVDVAHVDVSPSQAFESTLQRYESGIGSDKGGRPVPPKFIEAMSVNAESDVIDSNFKEYREAVNGSWWHYRNHPITKQEPQLLESSK